MPSSVSCICLTYNRPELLKRAVRDFLLQDYEGKSELVIFNTHPLQEIRLDHPMVKVVNWRPRPKSLGECRNMAVRHASHPVIVTWDDDDRYRHDHISNMVRELGVRDAVKVNGHLVDDGKGLLSFCERGPLNQIAFTKKIFDLVGGYAPLDVGEDREFYERLLNRQLVYEVFWPHKDCSYTYNVCNGHLHASFNSSYKAMGKSKGYRRGAIDIAANFGSGSKKVVNLVTNTTNGAGLQRHASILERRLKEKGLGVNLVHFKEPSTWVPADLNIHIEVLEEGTLELADRNWFMPMPEWYFESKWSGMLARMDEVICNTHHAVKLFQSRHPRVSYLGFESMDMQVPRSGKRKGFLHIAGKSINKNTEHVIQAWKDHKLPYDLTILGSREDITPDIQHPSIKIKRRVSDAEVRRLLNSHWFHICVSKYEGWGHYIHEAHSAGGLVIAHDQPPLNEFHAFRRVKAEQEGELRVAPIFKPDTYDLARVVEECMSLNERVLIEHSQAARESYVNEVRDFSEKADNLCRKILQ